MASQIPLALGISDRFTFSNYIPDRNQQVVDNLKSALMVAQGGFLYLWGKRGTGKSHLLHATCVEAAVSGKHSTYLPLNDYMSLTPDVMKNMENMDIVCIDDVDKIDGLIGWENALFTLFNQIQDRKHLLVMTSSVSPSGSSFKLQDLKSRLASCVIYHLHDLSENHRIVVLKERAARRGFSLSNEVLEYMVSRVARDMHSLLSWLDRLDEASLVSKRKITVPLLRELLND